MSEKCFLATIPASSAITVYPLPYQVYEALWEGVRTETDLSECACLELPGRINVFKLTVVGFFRGIFLKRDLKMSIADEELSFVVKNEARGSSKSCARRTCGRLVRTVCGCLYRFPYSGTLLKCGALAFGFWEPRKGFCAAFAVSFIAVDLYFMLATTSEAFICPNVPGTKLKPLFCADENATTNTTRQAHLLLVLENLNFNNLLSFTVKLSQLVSHLFFFWTVMFSIKKAQALTQEKAMMLVKPRDWLHLNVQITIAALAAVSPAIAYCLGSEHTAIFSVSMAFFVIQMLASLVSIWLFVMVTFALESCIRSCKEEIIVQCEAEIDDIIKIHKRLCNQVFNVSAAFQNWFVVHWITFAITAVFLMADLVVFVKNMFSSAFDATFVIVQVVGYVYLFVYPCYSAASVTAKCKQLLCDINMMTNDEWSMNSPFQYRRNLNEFIQYADYANCGYKIGNVNFGSNLAWFSTLLTLCGLGLRLL